MFLNALLIVCSFGAMLFASKKGGRVGSILSCCALPILLTCVVLLARQMMTNDYIEQDSNYYAAQAAGIGRELKARNLRGDILLLIAENEQDSPETRAFCRVLRAEGGVGDIAIRPLRLAAPDATRLCDRLDSADFETAYEEKPECGMVISLAGLPGDFAKLAIFRQKMARPFIAVCPEPMPLRRELERGAILAVVLPRPDAVFHDRPVKDYLAAFEERYCIFTTPKRDLQK